MIQDTPELRALLASIFPKLKITAVAKPSGQRVVFFCHFDPDPVNESRRDWHQWGQVVLKVSSGIDPLSIAYMQKEIEVLRGLQSPHYPKLLYNDVYSEDPVTEQRLVERLFITIEERVPAVPLSSCKERFRSEKQVAKLLLGLAKALEPLWMHKQRLVHRDLKPDNVLIKENGDVVIIDLGILRETGAVGNTSTGAPFGPLSAPYASPEQATNNKGEISFRSDFFALGTIAYELITTINPFFPTPTTGFLETLENVRNLHPERLHIKNDVSENFSNLIARLMEKEPFRRYRTVESLQRDLTTLC